MDITTFDITMSLMLILVFQYTILFITFLVGFYDGKPKTFKINLIPLGMYFFWFLIIYRLIKYRFTQLKK